ncbi:MAG: shikimate dehydrogenase [Thiolinea sp.]
MSEHNDRYAVLGHPVAHSKSPFIHARFAGQTAQFLTYEAIDVPLDGFRAQVSTLQAEGYRGCNVTVPFKEQAWDMAQVRSEAAEHAGAVNTLWFREDGSLYGDNTDGSGLLRDLQVNHQYSLSCKRILILGAGGAVRGVLQPLLSAQPQQIVIANRTAEKAEHLAAVFSGDVPVRGGSYAAVHDVFDVIINATAAGLQGERPPLSPDCLGEDSFCYDMMYGPQPTAFAMVPRTGRRAYRRWTGHAGGTGG